MFLSLAITVRPRRELSIRSNGNFLYITPEIASLEVPRDLLFTISICPRDEGEC